MNDKRKEIIKDILDKGQSGYTYIEFAKKYNVSKEYIRQVREKHNLPKSKRSWEELQHGEIAEKAGITPNFMSGIATGRAKPSLKVAMRLEDASKGKWKVIDMRPELKEVCEKYFCSECKGSSLRSGDE